MGVAGRPFRPWLLANPQFAVVGGLAFVWITAWCMAGAYDALNRSEPQEEAARWLLGGCLLAGLLGIAFASFLLGRAGGWLVLASLAGLLFVGDTLETLWSRWGMDWDGGDAVFPPVVVGSILFGIGLIGLRRSLGPQKASQCVGFFVAFFVTPLIVFAWATLSRFSEVARTAETDWTSEHGDPSLGAVAVFAALLVAAVAWRRRVRT